MFCAKCTFNKLFFAPPIVFALRTFCQVWWNLNLYFQLFCCIFTFEKLNAGQNWRFIHISVHFLLELIDSHADILSLPPSCAACNALDRNVFSTGKCICRCGGLQSNVYRDRFYGVALAQATTGPASSLSPRFGLVWEKNLILRREVNNVWFNTHLRNFLSVYIVEHRNFVWVAPSCELKLTLRSTGYIWTFLL